MLDNNSQVLFSFWQNQPRPTVYSPMYLSIILITILISWFSAEGHTLHHRKYHFFHRQSLDPCQEYQGRDVINPHSQNPRNHGAVEGTDQARVRKRGIFYIDARVVDWFSTYSSISWSWNWAQVPGKGVPENLEFVPTLWGNRSGEDLSTWPNNAWRGIDRGAKYLLAFNEPDIEIAASGSSAAPQIAAKVYREQFNPSKMRRSWWPQVSVMGEAFVLRLALRRVWTG